MVLTKQLNGTGTKAKIILPITVESLVRQSDVLNDTDNVLLIGFLGTQDTLYFSVKFEQENLEESISELKKFIKEQGYEIEVKIEPSLYEFYEPDDELGSTTTYAFKLSDKSSAPITIHSIEGFHIKMRESDTQSPAEQPQVENTAEDIDGQENKPEIEETDLAEEPEISNGELYAVISTLEDGTEPFRESILDFTRQILNQSLRNYPKELVPLFNSIVMYGKQAKQNYSSFKTFYKQLTVLKPNSSQILLFEFFDNLSSSNNIKSLYIDALTGYQNTSYSKEQLQDQLIEINEYLINEGDDVND